MNNQNSTFEGNFVIPIVGFSLLFFRIWMCEKRLKNLLEYRRLFLSRFVSYYFCFTLIFSFKNTMFNFITIAALPVILIAFFSSDIPFFLNFRKETKFAKKDFTWLILERIFLHIPLIVCGFALYLVGPKSFIPNLDLITVILSYVLVYGVFFMFDKRAFKIKGTGIPIFITGSASVIINSIVLMF